MKIPRAHNFIRCCIFYAQYLDVFARVYAVHARQCHSTFIVIPLIEKVH